MSAETKEDILREMRMGNSGDMPFAYLVGMPDTFEEFLSGTKMRKINVKQVTVKELADRFEAAFKRESVGNVAAMREALKQALYFLRRHNMGAVYAPDGETLIFCQDVANIVDEALSAPARQCDVGTAEEQAERYHAIGEVYHSLTLTNALAWAQTPYEAKEGGTI